MVIQSNGTVLIKDGSHKKSDRSPIGDITNTRTPESPSARLQLHLMEELFCSKSHSLQISTECCCDELGKNHFFEAPRKIVQDQIRNNFQKGFLTSASELSKSSSWEMLKKGISKDLPKIDRRFSSGAFPALVKI